MKDLNSVIKRNFTVPNVVSLLRILLIFPCIYFFLKDNYIIVVTILVASAISDMLDGLIARLLGQVTKLGQVLDPLADKLTLVAVGVCMAIKFPEIMPFIPILLLKDVAMMAAGAVLLYHKIKPTTAKWYGKISTAFFYFSVIVIVGLKAGFNFSSNALSVSLLLVTTIMMFFALLKYYLLFINLIKEKKSNSEGSFK